MGVGKSQIAAFAARLREEEISHMRGALCWEAGTAKGRLLPHTL